MGDALEAPLCRSSSPWTLAWAHDLLKDRIWESRQTWSPLCLERLRERSHRRHVVSSCPSTATCPSRDAHISSTSVSILRSGELQAELHISRSRGPSLLTSNEDSDSQSRTGQIQSSRKDENPHGSETRVQLEQQPGPHPCHQPRMLRMLYPLPCQQTQGNFYGGGGSNSPGIGPAPSLLLVSLICLFCRQHQFCSSPQNHLLILTQHHSQTHRQPLFP